MSDAPSPPTPPPVPTTRPLPTARPFPMLTSEASPESPRPPSPAWRGVLAKVPDSASLAAAARTPPLLRAFYRIPRPQWPKGKGFELVVIDPATKREQRFPIGEKEASPAAPEPEVEMPPVDPRVAERLVHEGHLNLHVLATVVPPLAPGSYLLRLDLGPHRSAEMPFRLTP